MSKFNVKFSWTPSVSSTDRQTFSLDYRHPDGVTENVDSKELEKDVSFVEFQVPVGFTAIVSVTAHYFSHSSEPLVASQLFDVTKPESPTNPSFEVLGLVE